MYIRPKKLIDSVALFDKKNDTGFEIRAEEIGGGGALKILRIKCGATKTFRKQKGAMKNFGPEKFHLHILVNCNVLNTISCKIWRKFQQV